MRYRIIIKVLLLVMIGLCGLAESASAESSLNVSEQVPFPFSEQTLEEEIDAAPFRQPPSMRIGTVSAGAVMEKEYGQAAPDPSSVLRPRYQMPEVQPQRNFQAKQVSGTLSVNAAPSMTSAIVPPKSTALPSTNRTPNRSMAETPPENEKSRLFEPTPGQNDAVDSFGHLINNAHTCDEWTCGGGGPLFHHLGIVKRGRGYCDACGLTTCSNKVSNQWFVDGWMTVGSTMNVDWPKDETNEPLRYNDRNGDIVMNQLYLSFGRKLDTRRNKLDVGGRIDVLYGTDYFSTSSLNLETRDARYSNPDSLTLNPYEATLHWNSNNGPRRGDTASLYGLSLPQAYGEVYLPFRFGTTVRAGHFYSGMSLESAMSPQNFFYSHSYSFMYGSPTTLTGFTATTQWNRHLSTILGITQGWNVFDNPMDRVNGLAGVQWETLDKETAISFLIHSGKESERNDDVRTGYTLTLKQLLMKRLHYALEHTLGYEDNAKRINLNDRGPARWVSLAQYLQWELNDQWSVGLRGEWFRDDGYSRIVNRPLDSFVYSVSGKNLFEVTFGVNWKPTRFMTIRPELRYDWADTRVRNKLDGTTSGIFNGNREMFSVAIDAIVRF